MGSRCLGTQASIPRPQGKPELLMLGPHTLRRLRLPALTPQWAPEGLSGPGACYSYSGIWGLEVWWSLAA